MTGHSFTAAPAASQLPRRPPVERVKAVTARSAGSRSKRVHSTGPSKDGAVAQVHAPAQLPERCAVAMTTRSTQRSATAMATTNRAVNVTSDEARPKGSRNVRARGGYSSNRNGGVRPEATARDQPE